MDEAVIESHDISSADRQGMTSILWENTAKLFDATSIAGSLNAHLDSFCDGHFSFKRSSKSREYLVRRAAKNVISPSQNPPKKQQCKNQECLASDKKKLIACARVRCKRRVDSVAASPREYLVRRAAKNVISPPQNPPQPPPKKQQCKNQECLASYKKKLIACARVRCKRRVDSAAASPREYLVRRAAKNVISPPQNPPKTPQETTMQKSRVSCKLQEELDSVCQGTVQEKSG